MNDEISRCIFSNNTLCFGLDTTHIATSKIVLFETNFIQTTREMKNKMSMQVRISIIEIKLVVSFDPDEDKNMAMTHCQDDSLIHPRFVT